MGDIFESLKNINSRFCSKWFINYSELDEEQKKIYDDENSFIVLGCAGSGKSVLAIHKLLKVLRKNRSYKMVLYTKALRTFIIDGIDSVIKTMDDIDGFEKYITDINNNVVIIDSLDNLDEKREFLIIDEIQDFAECTFEKLFHNSNTVIAFGDFEQVLYDNKLAKEDLDKYPYNTLTKYNLNKCYRVPNTVANFAQQIISNDLQKKCIEKRNEHKPYLIECEVSSKVHYFSNEIECVVNIICKNKYKDVGILVNDNESVFSVYSLIKTLIDEKYKNNPEKKPEIGFKYSNITKLKFGTMNSINVLSLHSCKGTEFENVFIVKCDVNSIRSSNDHNYKEALYVACTRTAERLFITHSKEICNFIPYKNKELYNKYIYKNNKLINVY